MVSKDGAHAVPVSGCLRTTRENEMCIGNVTHLWPLYDPEAVEDEMPSSTFVWNERGEDRPDLVPERG